MSEGLEIVVRAALIGIGATVAMDLWGVFLKRFFGIPSINWGLVGRWFGHFPRGRFVHDNIAKAPPVRGEPVIGWGAHYAIGIMFSVLLLAIWGLEWARHPTLLPALIIGLLTLAAPFFMMQPGMGAGIAASKTPNPSVARLRSIATHTVFGIGLYGSALLTALVIRP
ncbi:MAG: DUF2938 domain-containing protein [Rhizobiales bacterium]|nr:DUF2938 domain-containing protein [Hyphomicrobiales bacterium]